MAQEQSQSCLNMFILLDHSSLFQLNSDAGLCIFGITTEIGIGKSMNSKMSMNQHHDEYKQSCQAHMVSMQGDLPLLRLLLPSGQGGDGWAVYDPIRCSFKTWLS